MSDYTKLVDFAGKDSLNTGNPLKVIQGTEINDEFIAIATAVGSKANLLSAQLTGLPVAPTAAEGTDTTQLATTAYVMAQAALTTAAAELGTGAALPLSGGAMTGTITNFASTGIDDNSTTIQVLMTDIGMGIGTPATEKLEVYGNIKSSGSIQAGGSINTSGAGVTKWYQASSSGNPEFYIGASDTERLGIQTVYAAGSQSLNTVNFFSETAQTAANKGDMKFSCDGTLRLTLNDAGATVAGDILASGNITAYSDASLKSNVETIPDALEKVLSVRGVTFDMNGERGTGVIAQELEQVLPEAVFDNEETNLKSVAYGNVVGLLIEAIKEQQVQINTLMDMIGE